MPQLLRNINGIIEAFGRYARTEGSCTALTRGELKGLLEHEFADVIVKPRDPDTVDEVLRLLDEDHTGTVEFQEFLVLVFKVAQACFKTMSESPAGACGSQQSRGLPAGASQELGEEPSSTAEVGPAREGQICEGSQCAQSTRASRGQARAATQSHGQDLGQDRPSETQRQERGSHQTPVGRHAQQTQRGEDEGRQTGQGESETQPQTRGEDGSRQTGQGESETQPQTRGEDGSHQTRQGELERQPQTGGEDGSHQTRQGESERQPQTGGEDGSRQTRQGESETQPQTRGEDESRQTGQGESGRQPQTRGEDRAQQTGGPVTGPGTQTVEQDRSHQVERRGAQPQEPTRGHTRGPEAQGRNRCERGQVVAGEQMQTRAGPRTQTDTQTTEQDSSQTARHTGDADEAHTQRQPGTGHTWTQVNPYEAGEKRLGGQAQAGANTVTGRQTWSSPHPRCSVTSGQGQRESAVVAQGRADDHTREMGVPGQDHGSLHTGLPAAQGQEAPQPEGKQGLTARGLYSYLKSNQP